MQYAEQKRKKEEGKVNKAAPGGAPLTTDFCLVFSMLRVQARAEKNSWEGCGTLILMLN
jgi:hypothetical protein